MTSNTKQKKKTKNLRIKNDQATNVITLSASCVYMKNRGHLDPYIMRSQRIKYKKKTYIIKHVCISRQMCVCTHKEMFLYS